MSSKALAGLDRLAPKSNKAKAEPKPAKRPQPPKPVEVTAQEPTEPDNFVRLPRTVPTHIEKRVDALREAETLLETNGLATQEHTEQRREQVLSWMLNGHVFNGQLLSVSELATALHVPLKTVQHDVSMLKAKMADFYTDEDVKDVPAMAHMLMEMKFQDRGRGLALYNIIMDDIHHADMVAEQTNDKPQARKPTGLTGRDRAAMYSAALTALDLANKSTNGMESLFKLTGGAQRLQTIIKAKQVTINQQNNTVLTADNMQRMIADVMAGVMPSLRKANPELPMPKMLELTAEDEAVIAMGNAK